MEKLSELLLNLNKSHFYYLTNTSINLIQIYYNKTTKLENIFIYKRLLNTFCGICPLS
jgi:hypothetical protein